MISEQRVGAYLQRLRLGLPIKADEATLRTLHRRHLVSVPFENLDIQLGPPIVLEADLLVDKITKRRRGGFCYELNGAFAALLASLVYDVTMVEARVYDAEGGLGIRFDHLCLIVQLSGPLLVDVGFGALFDEPLRLDTNLVQRDAAGDFQLSALDDGSWDLRANETLQYRFDPVPLSLAAFEPGCRYHTTSPDSHFTQSTVCTRRTERGRVTIRDGRAIETVDGSKQTVDASGDRLQQLYRTWFGIEFSARTSRR